MTKFALRLPDEHYGRLTEIAEQDATSVNSTVVIAVEEYLARRQTAQVRAYARKVRERDAELLDRLAQ